MTFMQSKWGPVPEVEGGSVYNDITGQREGLCCEHHSQGQIQRPGIRKKQ